MKIIVRAFSGGQMTATTPFCEGGISHALLERFGNPRIVVLHDIFRHLRPFVCRQAFELFDDFCRTQGLIIRQSLFFGKPGYSKFRQG
jgi:hypothetical protein